MNSIILIVIIGLIIIIAGYFTYKMLTDKSNNQLDNEKINKALEAGNIQTLNKPENFEETIVFDSLDKIKNNFETFINIYFPSLDVTKMNKMLKDDYGINNSIQEIISGITNINMRKYVKFFDDCLTFIILSGPSETDLILGGLGSVVLLNLTTKYKIYYLNDYDTFKDFIVYFIPTAYDTNLIKPTNTDIKDYYTANGDKNTNVIQDGKTPYKISFNNYKKNVLKINIIDINPNPTDEDYNKFININKKNKDTWYKYCRLFLLGPLITSKTDNIKIINNIISTLTNDFTSDIKEYIPSIKSITRDTFILLFNETLT